MVLVCAFGLLLGSGPCLLALLLRPTAGATSSPRRARQGLLVLGEQTRALELQELAAPLPAAAQEPPEELQERRAEPGALEPGAQQGVAPERALRAPLALRAPHPNAALAFAHPLPPAVGMGPSSSCKRTTGLPNPVRTRGPTRCSSGTKTLQAFPLCCPARARAIQVGSPVQRPWSIPTPPRTARPRRARRWC